METITETISIQDPIWFVRISVSMVNIPTITDEVVYYRRRMTYDFVWRWMWYFEYLQARIKTAHPRRVVELLVGRENPNVLMGQEFIEHRRATLLKSKNRKLDELANKPYIDDLFNFTSNDIKARMEKLKNEIEALERGEITFPVIDDFVNKIKKWI